MSGKRTKADQRTAASKGGLARAAALSSEDRKEIARAAAEARWGMLSSLPRETHGGTLHIGDKEIACAVLDNGLRVLSTRGVNRAMGSKTTGSPGGDRNGAPHLPRFLASESIKPFISNELMARLIAPIEYRPRLGGRTAFGYEAGLLPDICKVLLAARKGQKLKRNQMHLADTAELLIEGLAHVGIIALVDEATGYQAERAKDELFRILEAYISRALLPWTRRFPDAFFKEIYRLNGWKFQEGNHLHPRMVGKMVNQLVYEQLPKGVLTELRQRNPVMPSGYRRWKHHQLLSEHIGQPHLSNQVATVVALMRASDTKHEFERLFSRAFPSSDGTQMDLRFEMGTDAGEGEGGK